MVDIEVGNDRQHGNHLSGDESEPLQQIGEVVLVEQLLPVVERCHEVEDPPEHHDVEDDDGDARKRAHNIVKEYQDIQGVPFLLVARVCQSRNAGRRQLIGHWTIDDAVRHEVGEVVGDRARTFTNTHTGRFAIDHPDTENGVNVDVLILTEELRWKRQLLNDETFIAIALTFALDLVTVRQHQSDVSTFPTENRLQGIALLQIPAGHRLLVCKPGRNEVLRPLRVCTEQLPEHGQDCLGAPQHLVGRLDPNRSSLVRRVAVPRVLHVCEQVARRVFVSHVFPGEQLEDDVEMLLALRVVVVTTVLANPQVFGVDGCCLVPCQLAGREHEHRVHLVLVRLVAVSAREVHHRLVAQLGLDVLEVTPPGIDQAPLQSIELIVAVAGVLQPAPLDCGLDERGWRVGVELVEHGDAHSSIGMVQPAEAEVEPPIDAAKTVPFRVFFVPAVDDSLHGVDRNVEATEIRTTLIREKPFPCLDTHLEDGTCRPLEHQDLVRSERVVGVFTPVPIQHRVCCRVLVCVHEPLAVDDVDVVRTFFSVDALHVQPP